MYYIGLDVHKKTISYCSKGMGGERHAEGVLDATRLALDAWLGTLPQPWTAALEATLFTGWIYDHLRPHATALKVAHPAMLRAIAASKKKNDQVDARKIADLLRCDLLPECYMAPGEFRERRRTLRYRNLLVRQSVQMKNRISGLLMETGVAYNKQKLHKKGYFAQLRASGEIPTGIQPLLKIGRETVERIDRLDRALVRALERDPVLAARVERLQTVLIEAAKIAPRWNADLALLHEKMLGKGNRNRATLAVARKLVAYLLAVDRREQPFQPGKESGLAA